MWPAAHVSPSGPSGACLPDRRQSALHISVPVKSADGGITPMYTQIGMSPSQVRTAYGLNPSITINGITGDGTGQRSRSSTPTKIARLRTDLTAFDNHFTPALPAPPNFLVLNQTGGTDVSGVPNNSNWAGEISLDVEWAHAIAPAANIVLFEANDAGNGLYTALATARTCIPICHRQRADFAWCR